MRKFSKKSNYKNLLKQKKCIQYGLEHNFWLKSNMWEMKTKIDELFNEQSYPIKRSRRK